MQPVRHPSTYVGVKVMFKHIQGKSNTPEIFQLTIPLLGLVILYGINAGATAMMKSKNLPKHQLPGLRYSDCCFCSG